MNKIILSLLSTPMLVSSLLSMGAIFNQAQAIEPKTKNTDNLSCIRNYHKVGFVCARASVLAQIPDYQTEVEFSADDVPMLEFNVEESEMAVSLYGCDCPRCINSLRQMRNIAPLVY